MVNIEMASPVLVGCMIWFVVLVKANSEQYSEEGRQILYTNRCHIERRIAIIIVSVDSRE